MIGADAKTLPGRTGRLRIGVNLGNAALVRDGPDGLEGPVASIGTRIAEALSLPVEWVRYPTGGAVLSGVGEWDIAFLAIDPSRGDRVAFTQPYAFVEASLAVAMQSPFATLADLTARKQLRVAHTRGAGYVGALRLALPEADLVAFDRPNLAVEALRAGEVEACAGLRAALEAESGDRVRLLPEPFQRVPQGIAVPVASAQAIGLLQRLISGRPSD